jgi:hypothetical protein
MKSKRSNFISPNKRSKIKAYQGDKRQLPPVHLDSGIPYSWKNLTSGILKPNSSFHENSQKKYVTFLEEFETQKKVEIEQETSSMYDSDYEGFNSPPSPRVGEEFSNL